MNIESLSCRAAACLSALALAVASPATAQTSSSGTFKTGAELLEACSSSDELELVQCDWYIMGVHDAIILHQDLELIDEEMCLSEGTQIEELRKVVLDYLRAAEELNFTAVSMTSNALEEKYACEGY